MTGIKSELFPSFLFPPLEIRILRVVGFLILLNELPAKHGIAVVAVARVVANFVGFEIFTPRRSARIRLRGGGAGSDAFDVGPAAGVGAEGSAGRLRLPEPALF